MPFESTILLTNVTNQSEDPTIFLYSDKKRGSGYSGRGQGLHTAVFELSGFLGTVKIQGSLEPSPGDSDWVDIKFDDESELSTEDSTLLSSVLTKNFTGNWLWIRAAYSLQQGSITRIRFNF